MKRNLSFILIICFAGNSLIAQEPKLLLPIGHSLGVSTAVYSPDGKRIVTSSLDNSVKIWEVSSGLLLANLMGHTDTVTTALYSPDGKKIMTACEDGTAKIWDAYSADFLFDMRGHTGKVFYAEFSPDGKKVITASEDQSAKIWDAETGKLLFDLKGHTLNLWWARFSHDGKKVVTTSEDHLAKVWDAQTGKILFDLKGHTLEVREADFSLNNKNIVSCSGDSTAKLWDAETGKLLFDLIGHKGAVSFSRFNPNGKTLLTGSDDGTVKVWDTETGKLLISLLGKKKQEGKNRGPWPDIVTGAFFSPDGKKILTVYVDSCVKIWDASTGKLLKEIKRNYEFTNSASFSPDSKKIALALAYAHVEIYDVANGNLLVDLKGTANHIQSFALSPNGNRILVSNWYGSAKLLDANTGTQVATFPARNNSERGVYARYSPDGKKIVTTTDDNIARVWDAASGIQLFELNGHKQSVHFANFSPDGKKIQTSSSDSSEKIWDAATGKLLTDIRHGQVAVNFDMSPDWKKILTAPLYENIVRIWSETGQVLADLKGHTKPIISASFSFNGEKILSYSRDSTAKIWDAETGTLLINIKVPFNHIRWAMFTPDGKRIILTTYHSKKKNAGTQIWDAESGILVSELSNLIQYLTYKLSPDGKKIISGTNEGSIVTMDLETGKLLSEIKGHTGPVFRLAFSPDRKKLLSGANDGTVKICDAETGTLLKVLNEHSFSIQTAEFSPDGKKVYTVSADHTAKVWDTETGASLYTFISVGRGDYLILDKYNHYDGSEAARKLLYFTCGTEVIELDQVKDQLWVPNLAERILNGETINAVKLSDLNICNLTPLVDTIEQSGLQYRFRITPRLGGLGATIVYVNGIEVKRFSPQQLIAQKEGYQLMIDKKEIQKFFVTHKENSITVKSLTAKNSISSRSVSINEKGNEKSVTAPNLYAIVVGVSDYKGEGLDLKFAAKDAIDMANALDISAKKLLNTDGQEHVFIYRVHTSSGRDRFPEKNSIKQLFTEIGSKAQPNDILLVFFAGHGVVESEKNQFYFLTADASNATVSGALKNVGIGTEELADWIQPQVMKAQKRILIFDACNSGQALKEIISFNKDSKNLLASRGDENGKQKKAIEKLNEKSGMFILSASASDQKAYEIGKYNQGALTYSLLKAIKEQPDILEDRQYLNISRWFGAAEKTVGELARETGTRQQPQVVSTSNFNIGVVDDEVRNKIVLPFEKFLFTRSDFRNTELRVDNLKLRNLVDKGLSDLSDENIGASLLFNPEYEGANIYSLSCDYSVANDEITASVIVIKGGDEIKNKFEVKGKSGNINQLSATIVTRIKDWVDKNK